MKQVAMETKDMKVDVTTEYTFCNLCGDQLFKRISYNINEIEGSGTDLKDDTEILKKYEHVHITVGHVILKDKFTLDKDICVDCIDKFRDDLRMKMEIIGFSVKNLGGD